MDSKNGGDHAELLQSLENVVMDLNDMENMIDNFEDDAAESFFTKVWVVGCQGLQWTSVVQPVWRMASFTVHTQISMYSYSGL